MASFVAGIYDTSQYACECSPIVVPTWLDFTDMINAIPVKPNQRTAMAVLTNSQTIK